MMGLEFGTRELAYSLIYSFSLSLSHTHLVVNAKVLVNLHLCFYNAAKMLF